MIKLIENQSAVTLTSELIRKGREPHSIMICGEHGLGKRTLARLIASQLLCEKGGGSSCGVCRSCRLIEASQHPDVITLESSETGNYKVENIRAIVSDAVISPNEARFKVYIIPDLDRSVQTLVQVQNILLKLIEEPPDHAVIILTARSKEIFLETIISRTLNLTVEEVTPAAALGYLFGQGHDPQQSEEAVRRCGGNIGGCLEYIADESVRSIAEKAAQAVSALAANDEYELLRVISSGEGRREPFIRLMGFMQRAVRDAVRLRTGAPATYVYSRQACDALGSGSSISRLARVYEILGEYSKRASSNCQVSALNNSLTAKLIEA